MKKGEALGRRARKSPERTARPEEMIAMIDNFIMRANSKELSHLLLEIKNQFVERSSKAKIDASVSG